MEKIRGTVRGLPKVSGRITGTKIINLDAGGNSDQQGQQWYKVFADTPVSESVFTISNPFGSNARVVSVKYAGAYTGSPQKITGYTADLANGVGVMLVSAAGGTELYTARQVLSGPGDAEFLAA